MAVPRFAWEFIGVSYGETSFTIDDIDVWKNESRPTNETIYVKDPEYKQKFKFNVNEINSRSNYNKWHGLQTRRV